MRGGSRNLAAACRGDFGATAAAAKIEAFMTATAEFGDASNSAANDLLDGCKRMGNALGMEAAELGGTDLDALRRVCGAVDARFREELASFRAGARIEAKIEATPPHCEVSMDAYARCTAECEAQVDPGSVELHCEGGELRGRCSAQCTGSCSAHIDAHCDATCEGICEGECSARASDGSCAGRCSGACHGECVAEARGRCDAECRGECSVEFQEPYCTGRVRPPSASARCRGACDARIEAEARCTPGQMRMTVAGGLDPAMEAQRARLDRAVREGLSAIVALRERVSRLRESGREIVRIAPELPNAAAAVGVGAVACSTAAAGAVVESMATVSVSVEVSVQVSASASVN